MSFSREFRRAILQDSPLEVFSSLFEQYKNPQPVLQQGEPDSLIHLAVTSDRLDVVKLLVQQGASLEPLEIYPQPANPYPEFQDFNFGAEENRFTGDPLLTAAMHGKQEFFNFLAPIASPEQRRKATLYLADGIKQQSISILENETECQRLSNARPSTADSDAFGQWLSDLAHSTISERDPSNVLRSNSFKFAEHCQNLIAQRLDIDHINDNGCTLLWTAAHNGYVEAVNILIQLGASVDVPNQNDGWTPLMIAVDSHIPWTFGTSSAWGRAESRQAEIISLLLQANATLDACGMNGETALSLASDYDPEANYAPEILDVAINEVVSILSRTSA